MSRWLLSTIGKRGYIADFLHERASAREDAVVVIGSGNDAFTPGFASCDMAALVPSIDDASYLDAVADLIEAYQIDCVVSLSDPDVATLSAARQRLTADGVNCFFPDPAGATLSFDKYHTYLWAQRVGFLSPPTSLDATSGDIGWPRVAKPRYGSASAGVVRLESPEDPAPQRSDYIYQRWLSGTEVNLEVLSDQEGSPLRVCVWQKLRSRHGETELAVTVRAPELVDLALEVATHARIAGPMDVDCILTEDGPQIIEINARFGGGYPVSHLAKAGFMDALLDLAAGRRVELSTEYEEGVFMMKALRPFGGRLSDAPSLLRLSDSSHATPASLGGESELPEA